MNATRTVLDEAAGPEPLLSGVSRVMVDLTGLLEQSLAPGEFYSEFLGRVLVALDGVAAAVWTCTPPDGFHLEYQMNLAVVGQGLDGEGRPGRAEVLRRAASGKRPLWVPAPGREEGRTGTAAAKGIPYAALLAPILVDDRVAGVVEIWQEPDRPPQARHGTARDLAMLAGVAAAYLHKAQWRRLADQERLWSELEAFARQVHNSLDPREVAYLVANEGRRLAGCDQVSVALAVDTRVEVEAVSGATSIEKRSRLVSAMHGLFESVLAWGQGLTYAGSRDDSLPPAVLTALDAYLAESNSRLLVVLPLPPERTNRLPDTCRATLMAECFESPGGHEELVGKLTVVGRHAASALHNAMAYRQASAGWLAKAGACVRSWTRGKRARQAALAAAVVLAVLVLLTVIPAGLRLEARGQLLPRERQVVYAHLHGKVVDMKAHHGERVEKGQELLFLEDLETQLKIEQLGLKAAFAEQRLAMLGEQIARAPGGEERNALVKERIAQEYELRKAVVERDLLLEGSLNPRKAAVLAPLAGKVVTFDTREQLVGKTVKPGDPLVRIARVDGPWEVELLVPEGRIAALREGLRRQPDAMLAVDLLLASHPLRSFRGSLRADGLGGETVVKDNAVVLPVRVQVVDPELAAQVASLPVGLELRAKIHCGERSLGRVWFGDLLEFFYEHVWF